MVTGVLKRWQTRERLQRHLLLLRPNFFAKQHLKFL